MKRLPLQPWGYAKFAVAAVFKAPLLVAPFALVGAISCLAALPGASNQNPMLGAGLLVSCALSIMVLPWAIQSLAAYNWTRTHPESPIPVEVQLKSGWKYFRANLFSMSMTMIFSPLGIIALGFGFFAALALGFWRTMLVDLGWARGRAATDQAWERAGAGGLLWVFTSMVIAAFIAMLASSAAAQLVGGAAIVLIAPIMLCITTALSVPAALDRISAV